MNKMLFVNLTDHSMKEEKPDEEILKKDIGGYGVGARILLDRMRAGVDPLGPENLLGFITGPMTGTGAQIASRYTVVAKSPLTGTWGDANSGGWFGPKMKHSGFDALFFEGIAENPVYLVIKDGQAEIKEATRLWGLDTYRTEDVLRKEYGKDAEIACIGPASEKLSLISGTVCNKGRLAARSGLGAVMGSKRLKAIVALGGLDVPVADPEGLRALRKEYIKTQSVFADLYKSVGTPGLVEGSAQSGDMPTKNWQSAVPVEDLDLNKFRGEAVAGMQAKKWGCWKCSLACGGVMKSVYEKGQEIHSHHPSTKPSQRWVPCAITMISYQSSRVETFAIYMVSILFPPEQRLVLQWTFMTVVSSQKMIQALTSPGAMRTESLKYLN